MKANQPKLKTTPRSHLFSCGFFRHCTQTVLSPTNPTPPPLPPPPPPAAPPHAPPESSSSSSSNTSQSFTQWRFPLSNSCPPRPEPEPAPDPDAAELFRAAEIGLGSGSGPDRAGAVQLLERSLVPNPRGGAAAAACPAAVVGGVVRCLREGVARKAASKVLLALCLAEGNRRAAVGAGAVAAVVEALADAESAVAERSLAALELLCTTPEGAEGVRAHALAVPMMVQVMGGMEGGRGKEHAISVLAVIYGGGAEEEGGAAAVAPAEEVARAVTLALQGECSARARRKGAQLLKILQNNNNNNNNNTNNNNNGRLELSEEER